MKRQRIYVDTSVLGGCFDPEFSPWPNFWCSPRTSYRSRQRLSLCWLPTKRKAFSANAFATTCCTLPLPASPMSMYSSVWNFRHIVRLDKIRLFGAVNLELGYKPLPIYSPREVATYGEE